MTAATGTAILPGPRSRDKAGRRYLQTGAVLPDLGKKEDIPRTEPRQSIPETEPHNQAWLTWRAYGRQRPLKRHKVAADGSIIEMHDPQPEPRQKPKGVSSRQWRRA